MRKATMLLLSLFQANLSSSALAQSISLNPNQSVNIRNTCASGQITTGQVDLFLGTKKVGSFPVNSDLLSLKISPGQYGKIGDSFTVFCDSQVMAQLKLIGNSVKSDIKSGYIAYRSENKIYLPNIYLNPGDILKVNGEDLRILKDDSGKYILDSNGSIKIEYAEYYDPIAGHTIQVSESNGNQIAIASQENFTDLGALIAAYNKIKGVDPIRDWTNVSLARVVALARPVNQNNDICGKNIYVLQNLTSRQRASLGNVSHVSWIPVNPTGSLWPTGLADTSSVSSEDYSDVAALSNLNNRHAKYAKNKVTIHILDTASQTLDDYSASVGQVSKEGHGSIIGSLIQEMIDKSGFGEYIKIGYVDVCENYKCDPITVSQKICEIAKSARNSSDSLHIINLSMSSRDSQDFLRLALTDAVRANVSVVMSSGNKTTCNGTNTGNPIFRCLLYPVDSFNISSFSEKIDRKTYVRTLNSTKVDAVNLSSRGIYSIGSMTNKEPDRSINRERPFGTLSGVYTRSNIPSIYAPSAYYFKENESLYAGTSFSTGYFAAALSMYRSCDRQKRVGPNIFADGWAQNLGNTPSLALDVDKMLAGICYQ
ncbi:hypothetical protein [Deinococcus aquaticus]|uniref:hypothetical protein n=1 Tax=Deinococcus aquaticus TaxID=328692 RepID=UPI003F470B42